MEAKLKHLEFIQNTINRMARNSFLLKGWMVTIVVGLFAISLKEIDITYSIISLFVLLFFWMLDSYYLYQEKLFIALYNHTRELPADKIDFSMSTDSFKDETGWLNSSFSNTMKLFYGGLVATHLIILFFIW